MTAEISTSDLIRRCRAGDQAARDLLFARYRHYLWLLAQAQIGGRLLARCDPSDFVHQTLLEALLDFAALNRAHEVEFVTFLRQILAHKLFYEARPPGATRSPPA